MNKCIAIHSRTGSFSDRWVAYCKTHSINFRIVDCHQSDIMQQIEGCSGLMWHFTQGSVEDMLIARAVVESAEAMGINVFPNSRTSWHFDDKIAQKYLLEAIGAPCVPTHVFVEKEQALAWLNVSTFPKVFKLRNGAGSSNVRLVKNRQEARKLIDRAFSRGFPAVPRWQPMGERWWQFKRDRSIKSLLNISRGFARAIIPNPKLRRLPRQSGYAYFQDFVPENDSDIRIIVIGERAFAIKRMVRDGDFRASGSGRILHSPEAIPKECLEISFGIAEKLETQSLALDYVFAAGRPLLVEISYAFLAQAYLSCPGYWKRDLSWVEGKFSPETFMIEDFLTSLELNESCT